jgi:endonuclease YncB( thermonuclease family)
MRRVFPLLLVLLAACPAWGSDYSARVIGISDGDTITVLTADRVQHRIRLHGIDAPETGQDFGSRAKQAASALAFGKTVTVRARDTDRYGRTAADVILPDGRSLNRQMVREGFAWRYRKVPNHGVIDPRPWPSIRNRLEEGLPRLPVEEDVDPGRLVVRQVE